MRRETALSHVRRIAQHLHSINGILATPNAQHAAVVIRRAWVFGSTAKGSPEPCDVDILLDIRAAGARREFRRGLAFDKEIDRLHGVKVLPRAIGEAVESLRQNMRGLSFHRLDEDGELRLDPLQMIYPRMDFVDLDWRKREGSELLRTARFLDSQAKVMPSYEGQDRLSEDQWARWTARDRFIEIAVVPAWTRWMQAERLSAEPLAA